MHLKSFKIKNFRKFGDIDNVVEFVRAKGSKKEAENTNIALSTTLIVGKNNSGKTTVTEAVRRVIENRKFYARDFNFVYLSRLLDEYRKNEFKDFPKIEFEVVVGIDFECESDLFTNIAHFVTLANVEEKTKDCHVLMKWEIKEATSFKDEISSIIKIYKDDAVLFRKFLKLIDDTDFKFNYYNLKEDLVEGKFNINDLLKVKTIKANKEIHNKSLSNIFNRIIKLLCTDGNKTAIPPGITSEIDSINKTITDKVTAPHAADVNIALSKIESSDHMEVSLRPDLTFEDILSNIIKYEYKEGNFYIPEEQFGLGYSNLMMIIGELIEYIEEYPQQDCHSKINLICIEEPEAFMHCQMQELFIKHINDAIDYLLMNKKKEINSQLIVTTHSPHILNSKIHSGDSFDNISYITILDNFSNVVNLNDVNVMGGKGDEGSDDLKFLKKHIKYKVSELFFSDAVIFVEGVTEETLLSYYIDQDEDLNRYYISVFNINGAHGLVYHPLIELLKVPCLIITDLDIKREEAEKEACEQIVDLKNRITTNKTIAAYNLDNEKIENLDKYFEKDNMCVVFQFEALEGYYATSFEEAFILTNYNNDILNKVLATVKPGIYKKIVGDADDRNKLKENSYKLQRGLSKSKSDFSNELLYEIVIGDGQNLPELPKYITYGLDWLRDSVKKMRGGQ